MFLGIQWYFWLILLVAIVGLIFMWHKVLVSSKERRERMKKEAAIWKRDYELRESFSVLTEEKLKETDDLNLLHGVAMNIQISLEKETDMTDAFNNLPVEKQYIYALEYFDEDAKQSLSQFFKNNGSPLINLIPEALFAIKYDKITDFVTTLLPMYDEDSEVSVDYSIINKTDEEFKSVYDSNSLCRYAAKYIKENKEITIDDKKISIKHALIKADIVTISIGVNDLFYKFNIGNEFKMDDFNDTYTYIDEVILDIDKMYLLCAFAGEDGRDGQQWIRIGETAGNQPAATGTEPGPPEERAVELGLESAVYSGSCGSGGCACGHSCAAHSADLRQLYDPDPV